MKNIFIYIIFVYFFVTVTKSQELIDTKGRDFWLAFPPNYHNILNDPVDDYTDSLYIYIVADEPCSGVIDYTDIFGRKFSHNFKIVDPAQIYTFSVPFDYFELRGFNESGIIRQPTTTDHQCEEPAPQTFNVRSDKDITVYAHQQAITTSESMTCLPTDALGTNYIVLTYNSDGSVAGGQITGSSTPSQFVIIATENETEIEISPSVPTYIRKNNKQLIKLQKGEAYLVQADITQANSKADLTGTIIKSNKPIALIAGHQRTRIPIGTNVQSRDCLLEMLPPVNAWGRNAIVVPFAQHSSITSNSYKDLFRIMAGADNTQISIDGQYYGTLNQGKYFELELTNPWFIEASGPILVAQYKKSAQVQAGDYSQSDPLMMITPPVEQYGNFYRIANIQAYERDFIGTLSPVYSNHHINIVALDKDVGKVKIDGNPIDASSFKKVPNSQYSYAILQVQEGTHELTAPSGFGLSVYGYGFANSYGYYGGMNLAKYDFTPPIVRADTSCFSITGVVTDSSITDSKIQSIEFSPIDLENVDVSYSGTFLTPIASFKATLIDKYRDGTFSIKATDSAGLYTYLKYDILGFTIHQKGFKESSNPFLIIDTIPANKEVCYKLELENYGKFPHTINRIIIKRQGYSDSVLNTSPLLIQPKTTSTFEFCVNFANTGQFDFDIFLEDTCTNRLTHQFSIFAYIDKTPPELKIVSDSCKTIFEILSSEILKTDIGIKSVEITDVFNGTYKILNTNSKEVFAIFTIDDPRQDASFTIIAIDLAGNVRTEKIIIPGYTLTFSIKSSIDKNILNFGERTVGYRHIDTIYIENYGSFPIELQSPKMSFNQIFSLPQSQFPIIILPQEKKPIIVVYKPTKAKKQLDDDTIYFKFNCLGDKIILLGQPLSYEIQVNSKCQVPLKFKTDSIPLFLEASLKSSMVQSNAILDFNSDLQIESNLEVLDILGKIIYSQDCFTIPQGRSQKLIDFSNFPSEIYFIKIEIVDKILIFKVLKE